MAIDRISTLSSMTGPVRDSVDVSRNEMERSTKTAMDLPLAGRAIDWTKSVSLRICNSASWDPVDTSKDLIFWSSAVVKIR